MSEGFRKQIKLKTCPKTEKAKVPLGRLVRAALRKPYNRIGRFFQKLFGHTVFGLTKNERERDREREIEREVQREGE